MYRHGTADLLLIYFFCKKMNLNYNFTYLGRCYLHSVGSWVAAKEDPVCPQTPEIERRRYRGRDMTVTRKGASVNKQGKKYAIKI